MASIYERKQSPWLWIKWRDADGKRHQDPTTFRKGDPAQLREALAAAEQLDRRVMPERAAEICPTGPAPERWTGQVAEDVAGMRRRLADLRRDAEGGR